MDLVRLDRLRQQRLQSERLASNPDGTRESHLEWIEKDPTAIQDVRRWRWVKGQEVIGEDSEESDSEGAYV